MSLIINTSEGNYYKIKYQNYDSENYTVTLNYEVMEEVVLPNPFSFNSNETGIQSLNNVASGDTAIALGNYTTASEYAATSMGSLTTASGSYSTVMGYTSNASGSAAVAGGWFARASGLASTAFGQNTQANGNFSLAVGFDNNAEGEYSVTMGYNSYASGSRSFAVGDSNQAIGESSTALGQLSKSQGAFTLAANLETTAGGISSTALGKGTKSGEFASLAIGHYNTETTYAPNQYDILNTAFAIGNGTDNENRSNALSILFDGTTTIAGNVTAPAFIGDGSQLTNLPSGTFSFNENMETAIQSPWSTATGNYSNAFGNNNIASGYASLAMGSYSEALGQNSVTIGGSTKATGNFSTAMGNGSIASGNTASAMGYITEASGTASTAMGNFTKASGNESTAMGNSSIASGVSATAMGHGTLATGKGSTAMGTTTFAIGEYTTSMGVVTTAEDFASVSIGQFNKADETPNPSAFSLQNTALVIGNGEDTNNRSNALEVLFDGTTTIAGDLNINSDARLKANIISLGATLSKLLQIDGKTYTMKKDANHKKKIGLLAQDIEKVFPELVSETNNIKSVNYQGLVPVLINAIKEQHHEIERLKKQEKRLRLLEQKVNTLLDK